MPPPTLPLLRRPTAKDLRQQLHQLSDTAQALQAERIGLEYQLRSVHERTTFNDNQIRRIMNELDQRLFKEHRSQSQPDFQRGVIANDLVIDGICTQMQLNSHLKGAVEAISKNQGTISENNLLLMAVLNELSGDPYHFAHHVAVRLVEYSQVKDQERQNPPVHPSLTSALPGPIDPYLAPLRPAGAEKGSTRAVRDSTVISLRSQSPSIKSEDGLSEQDEHAALPTRSASALNDIPGPIPMSAAVTVVPLADQGNIVAHGMSALQKNFPGLLESLSKAPVARIKPAFAVGAMAASGLKRGRESTDNNDSPPGPVKAGKKARIGKEPAIAHTFVLFMKRLEQLHQSGQDIGAILKCSRCQAIKRDVRVLNCLHLYCHRCILWLRHEAQKGDAVRGFQSFCVQPECKQVVSGKTTVIDSEIMEFLQWYDKQSPAVTSLPAQLNVLSSAVAKYPEDDEIKHKLEQMQLRYKTLQANAVMDVPCDLMQIAKLARKPY
ncbi:hypothetical protein AYO21_01818 [Fonsecaea monophora]|uniref:RING-type domain-containing protein n=1 Tax=Fonsecaea monophora TaxID=254056 RepID=A0A177FJT4_9EURO|nr:hypothetical protein AYO21_01818 [Fonsecaea monophora]OAG43966.1 hypothetical protein AYO21_01818 [Fonsecaea monophora]